MKNTMKELLPVVALSAALSCGASSAESAPPVSYEVMAPRDCVMAAGEPLVFDFTKGIPAGGEARVGSKIGSEGLCVVDATNGVVAS